MLRLTPQLLILIALTGCQARTQGGPSEAAEPRVQTAPPPPTSTRVAKARAPGSAMATAPGSAPKAAMPALPSAGWHRVSRVLPQRLTHPVWDAKTQTTYALGARHVYAWNGKAWQPQAHTVGEGRSQLVACPDGVWVVRMRERAVFVHRLGAAPKTATHTVPERMWGARINPAWHPGLKQMVLHMVDQNGSHAETFVLAGERLKRVIAKAPPLMGIGWDGARMAGFDVHDRLYHLDGTRWRVDPERLPGAGRVFAPDGALWTAGEAMRWRAADGWKTRANPPGDFYGARIGFDVGRDQVLLWSASGPDAGRTWVSAGGAAFAPVDMGPWWRPTTQSFELASGASGLRHLHGARGVISRLTPAGWRIEVPDGLKVDEEWGASFNYGQWDDTLLRADPNGALWRSHPWRRVKYDGDGPHDARSNVTFASDGARLIAHDADTGRTQALEEGRWRVLSTDEARADSASMVTTPKGLFLLSGRTLWRLNADAWQPVHRAEGLNMGRMVLDARRGALLALSSTDDDTPILAVFEGDAWRSLAKLPPERDIGSSPAFGIDATLRRAVLMSETGEVWMLDLDQHDYQGSLPTAPLKTPQP